MDAVGKDESDKMGVVSAMPIDMNSGKIEDPKPPIGLPLFKLKGDKADNFGIAESGHLKIVPCSGGKISFCRRNGNSSFWFLIFKKSGHRWKPTGSIFADKCRVGRFCPQPCVFINNLSPVRKLQNTTGLCGIERRGFWKLFRPLLDEA